MSAFKRGGSGGKNYGANRNAGRPASGRSPFKKRMGGGGGGGRLQMHDAICDECNKECEVPFMPSGNKPVLCRNCFDKVNGEGGSGSPRGGRPMRESVRRDTRKETSASMTSDQFVTLNNKLDKIIKLLED